MLARKLNPEGRGPVARAQHSACFFRNQLIIYGGRNDSVFPVIRNVALNDLHIYDVKTNRWAAIAMYGDIPGSRWGHRIVANNDKIMLFGGMNLTSYCESVLYDIHIDDNIVIDYLSKPINLKDEQRQKTVEVIGEAANNLAANFTVTKEQRESRARSRGLQTQHLITETQDMLQEKRLGAVGAQIMKTEVKPIVKKVDHKAESDQNLQSNDNSMVIDYSINRCEIDSSQLRNPATTTRNHLVDGQQEEKHHITEMRPSERKIGGTNSSRPNSGARTAAEVLGPNRAQKDDEIVNQVRESLESHQLRETTIKVKAIAKRRGTDEGILNCLPDTPLYSDGDEEMAAVRIPLVEQLAKGAPEKQ